jgi:hypothetical protein
MGTKPAELVEQDWYLLFPRAERARVKDSYTQMLLSGIASLDTQIERVDGLQHPVNLRLVAVHDHKMRLVGHHCMIQDESRPRSLEQQVLRLSEALAEAGFELTPEQAVLPGGSDLQLPQK